jgi:TRAP-type C4-dicarboxylate transport system permease small subunit
MKAIMAILSLVALAIVASALWAIVVAWCWNYTMPYLFHLPTIGYLRAFCLCLLATVFFKSSVSTTSK